MKRPIGGFFELEVAEGKSLYHEGALHLTTGRSCLNYVVNALKPRKIYLPYYCCDVLVEPMINNNIEYEFYAINEQLEIQNCPVLKPQEFIIYTDFFGVRTEYVKKLTDFYKEKLIIDNTHSFFAQGEFSSNFSFTSARKYFGVPDGAFLYLPEHEKPHLDLKRNTNISIAHSLDRMLGFQEKAFLENTRYEKTLNSEIERISIFSEKVLSTVDYQKVRKIRNENYNFFRKEFEEINTLHIDKAETDCFCYPLLLEKPIDKEEFYKEKIFIASLWLDTLNRTQKNDFKLECRLSQELLPLPIDHRYTFKDLERVINTMKKIWGQ